MIALALLAVLAAEPSASLPEPNEVEAVVAGDTVKRTGLWISEERFQKYLAQQVRADRAEAKTGAVSEELRTCLVRCEGCKAPAPGTSTFSSGSFIFGAVVGTIVGVAITGAATYGIYVLARDTGK